MSKLNQVQFTGITRLHLSTHRIALNSRQWTQANIMDSIYSMITVVSHHSSVLHTKMLGGRNHPTLLFWF